MAKITIVGFGNMGKAIKKALDKNKAGKIFPVDLGLGDIKNVQNSDFVILSVKPQDAKITLSQIKKAGLKEKSILISILAGFPIKKIQVFSGHRKVVRLMPNLGLLTNSGIAVWKETNLTGKEKKKTKIFLNKITENFEVKNEEMINRATALSGSGPAYFLLLAESLMKASQKLGFKKEESRKLVEKTFLSAALLQKNSEYSELLKKITSKKGTTEMALKIFRKNNFDQIVLKAVLGAYQRAKELGDLSR